MHVKGNLLSVVLVPHPPIMVKEVAREEFPKVEQTAMAMQDLTHYIHDLNPDTMIVITPHGPVFSDAIAIYDADKLQGDLSQFGAGQVKVEMDFDRGLAEVIIKKAAEEDIYVALLDAKRLSSYGFTGSLDHGVVAPLSFFSFLPPTVVMSMGLFPPTELYKFGVLLRESIEKSGKKAVIIVSGDMSHKITADAPAGYHRHGAIFDKSILGALEAGDFEALFDIPEDVCKNAGECGYRALLMGIGALEGYTVDRKVYSYQAPFGVGYLIAHLTPQSYNKDRAILSKIQDKGQQELAKIRSQESPPVQLARLTVERHVSGKEDLEPETIRTGLSGRAGVFVSIKKQGQLRGCIGTTGPTTNSISEEIMTNAINAAEHDPRFFPISKDELPYLTYSVDVLTEAVEVKDRSELDPSQYGVIVRSGNRSGLLLPDLDGVDTVEEQLNIVLQKAVIEPQEKYDIYKFEVIRYK